MKITLPENVKYIIDILEQAGYEAYAVGGCVRDSVLGRQPNDWDITTSAKPLETKALFRRTIDTGLQHGTITVMLDGEGYEITTYRIDGEYEDGRHPKSVAFTSDLVEDLKRRDFTINAMAYNDRKGLVDVFEGMEDIRKKRIRCVGDATERFAEDALRMLRAVRFSAQLGFQIEEATKEAVCRMAENLKKVSAERIQTELEKLLLSPNPEDLRTAWELGLTRIFLPEFDAMMETEQKTPYHFCGVGEHTLYALKQVRADKLLRWSVLMHDVGKPGSKMTDEKGMDHFHGHAMQGVQMAETIMKRLRMDNDTIRKVKILTQYHDTYPELTPKGVRRMVYKVGEPLFSLLLEVQQADVLAHSDLAKQERLERIRRMGEIFAEIKEKQECLSLKDLAVSGQELIADGMKPGKEMGSLLNQLLQEVLEYPEHNTKEYLLAYSRSLRGRF